MLLDRTPEKREQPLSVSEEAHETIKGTVFTIAPSLPLYPITGVDSHFEAVTGYSPQEVIGQPFNMLFDIHQPEWREVGMYLQHRQSFASILKAWRKNGELLLVHLVLSPMFNLEGEIEEWVATYDDMRIDSYPAKSQLLESHLIQSLKESPTARIISDSSTVAYRRLVDSNILGFMIGDINGTVLDANDIYLQTIGYTREELKSGKISWKKLIPPEHLESSQHIAHMLLTQGYCPPIEEKCIRKDGTYVYLLSGFVCLDGSANKALGFSLNITEQKRQEAQIIQLNRELQTRFATTFEQTAVGIAHITQEEKWLRFNHKYQEILGYSESDLISLTVRDITYPEDISIDDALIQQLYRKEIPSFSREKRYIRKDGSLVWVQLTMSAVWRDSGEHDYNIAIIEDISQRKASELLLLAVNQQLSLKNEALLDFVLIASHDLQEPLRKMTLFSERLKQQAASQVDQDILFNLEKIEQSAKRMNELIEGLSDYSRLMTKPQEFTQLNLNELIADVLSDFEFQIREANAVIEVDPLPMVPGDKIQLRQLFQNLLSNALKFRRKELQPLIRIYPQNINQQNMNQLHKASHVCIVVEDNGIGFEEKYAQTIFKMFERLHPSQIIAGTGIGLAICKKIVECHGGSIQATSQLGQGSRFFITLPLLSPHVHSLKT